MQTRKEDNAFPVFVNDDDYEIQCYGLSKREYFAAMAMQGLLASGMYMSLPARKSIEAADQLIKELNEQP
jgi:hypothetical protein